MRFVHIGQPKTGSTSLQEFFARNRVALADRGVSYPEALGGGGNATAAALRWFGPLPTYFRREHPGLDDEQPGFEGSWTRLVGRADPSCPHLLLSSEELSLVPPEEFRRRAELRRGDTQVFCFLRRQDEAIESSYRQEVEAGLVSDDLTSYVERILDGSSELSRLFRYHDWASEWVEAFGADHVTCWPYDARQPSTTIYERALGALGLPLDDAFVHPPRRNPSIHPLVVEYLREVNRTTDDNADHRAAARRAAAALDLDAQATTLLSDELRRDILAAFAEQNRRAAEEFVAGSDPLVPERTPVPVFDPDRHGTTRIRLREMVARELSGETHPLP